MKISIIGSPQAGQQQLFSLMTGLPLETIQQKPLEVQQGICEVIDPRVTKLKGIFNPKKTTYARIEYLLLPDFNLQGPSKAAIFTQLKNADEFCWISRAENAEADIAAFLAELIISDLMLVEKRLETIAKDQKKKFSDLKEKEKTLMELCKKQLEQEKPLKELTFTSEQLKLMRTYQFMSMKPTILVINVTEDNIKDSTLSEKIQEKFSYPAIQLSAELEAEINQLEKDDQAAFLQEMGITEPALDKMARMAFEGLGLISFFTVGEDEVRAWPVKVGSTAPEAGSTIHSDIAKGFVRAEMYTYDDFIAAGSEAKLKEQGKFHLKGRDYVVQDSDILSFRFNV
ncbi:MAG: DUF933 domain-containing protein [Candidatus Margulisiibacteriota bacterium]